VQGFFSGISFRLARIGVLIALTVGFIMSAVQLYLDFEAHKAHTEELIGRITEVSTPPAARAVHTLDNTLAAEVVNGLLKYDFITSVTIEDELGNDLASGKKPRASSNTRWVTRQLTDEFVVHSSPLIIPSDANVNGKISFVVDMDAAFQPLYRTSLVVLVIGFARSAVLVSFLFIAFHYLLTKPLIRISNEIRAINPGSPGEQRIPLPLHHNDDELVQLVRTANQLLDAVDLALAKQRAVEVVLRKSEEHVRQIIDSLPVWVGARNKDGHYIFANKALAEFLDTTPEDMRGSHVSEFSDMYTTDHHYLIGQDQAVIDRRVGPRLFEETWKDTKGRDHQMQTYVMPMEFYDETVALVVSSDITELKGTQAQMEHMAYHDALTDLPNRSYLVERLEEELHRAARHKYYGALLFIDLDQFKNINDSLGHPVGDGVLKHVAERLRQVMREEDLVIRLGGDEFVVVLTYLDEDMGNAVLKAEDISEKVRQYVSEPYFYNELELRVTCSVGLVIFPEEDAGVHELLRFADAAMYQVKEQGRNAIQFFNRTMADRARSVLVMEGDLHHALEQNRFSLQYQPRVDAQSGKIVGCEALLRWHHPKKGMVPPSDFIPILETSGLIVDVGMWVIEEACRQLKQWEQQGYWRKGMHLSVNISPRQFRSARFVKDVFRITESLQVPPQALEMEITESIVIHNLDETIATMNELQAKGILFSLDDFGTGYSSISYLKRLPVSVLKIDQSFVRDITVDRNDRVLVETISAMGNLLGLNVVAEGVETEEQMQLVREYGCQYYQGYLCSRPVDPDKFEALLEDTERVWHCPRDQVPL
jgi:diguanylate cyclase (GGDEF)-like protein/PAS domain S-box-containing protein